MDTKIKTLTSLPVDKINERLVSTMKSYGVDFMLGKDPEMEFDIKAPHRIDGYVVAILCHKGSSLGYVNFKEFAFHEGDFVILLTGQIVSFTKKSDDFSATYIFMSEKFTSSLEIADCYRFFKAVDQKPILHLDPQTLGAIQNFIDMSTSIMDMAPVNPNAPECLRLLTKLFFLSMAGFMYLEDDDTEEIRRHDSYMIDKFIYLVKNHCREQREVAYYADEMCITPKYLTTLVRRVSRRSASDWIEEYVILEAKSLLSSTQMTIQQVAYALNFPTQSMFGRYFKRATGLTCTEYRKAVQGVK